MIQMMSADSNQASILIITAITIIIYHHSFTSNNSFSHIHIYIRFCVLILRCKERLLNYYNHPKRVVTTGEHEHLALNSSSRVGKKPRGTTSTHLLCKYNSISPLHSHLAIWESCPKSMILLLHCTFSSLWVLLSVYTQWVWATESESAHKATPVTAWYVSGCGKQKKGWRAASELTTTIPSTSK